jgi:hypothetical protein
VFRDVALEALRGGDDAPPSPDLGLADESSTVNADSATFLDASKH